MLEAVAHVIIPPRPPNLNGLGVYGPIFGLAYICVCVWGLWLVNRKS